jgi:hypothetical protein
MVRQANLSQATGTPKVIWKYIYIHVEEIKGRSYSPGCWGIGKLKHAKLLFCRMNLMHDE